MLCGDRTTLDWLRARLPGARRVSSDARTYRLSSADACWTLEEDGVELGDAASRERIVMRLLERLNQLACFTNPSLSVHSGLVVDDLGRGIWLPAASGGGKTTLTAQLTMTGLRYGTDEVAVLRSGGRVEGWPKWLAVKPGSQAVLRVLAPQEGDPFQVDGRWMVAPASAGEISAGPVAPVLVAFPEYDPKAVTWVEPITRAAAVARIVPQAFNLREHGVRGLDSLVEVVGHAESCVRIGYSDGWDASRALSELLRTLSLPAGAERTRVLDAPPITQGGWSE